MKTRATTRSLLALALISVVMTIPTAAGADNHCTFRILPSPGWVGASASIEGFNMSPNVGVTVLYTGQQVSPDGKTTNGNGYFKVTFTIPQPGQFDDPNWIVFADSGCQMNDSRSYTIGPAPTTTTTAATTTTTTTTTTLPPTTTTLAPTTTVAAPTTTVADDTTTTAGSDTTVADTTTTTVVEEDGGGGIPLYIWVVIAALGGLILFLIGKMSSRRR